MKMDKEISPMEQSPTLEALDQLILTVADADIACRF